MAKAAKKIRKVKKVKSEVPETLELYFSHDRCTKNKHLFKELIEEGGDFTDEGIIESIYLPQSYVGGSKDAAPNSFSQIKVTIEFIE